jgi:RhoGAP domain/RhoGEF domain
MSKKPNSARRKADVEEALSSWLGTPAAKETAGKDKDKEKEKEKTHETPALRGDLEKGRLTSMKEALKSSRLTERMGSFVHRGRAATTATTGEQNQQQNSNNNNGSSQTTATVGDDHHKQQLQAAVSSFGSTRSVQHSADGAAATLTKSASADAASSKSVDMSSSSASATASAAAAASSSTVSSSSGGGDSSASAALVVVKSSTADKHKLNASSPLVRAYVDRTLELLCLALDSDVRQAKAPIIEALNATMHGVDSAQSGLMPPHARRGLATLVDVTQTFLAEQERLDKIVRIQSLWRKRVLRAKYRALDAAERRVLVARAKVFRELVVNERSYLRKLDVLCERYLQPVRTSLLGSSSGSGAAGGSLLDIADLPLIFANVEELRTAHRRFLRAIEIEEARWPYFESIGKLFLQFAPSLRGYGVYFENYRLSCDSLERLRTGKTRRKDWIAFLASVDGSGGSASSSSSSSSDGTDRLLALLRAPLEQVPQYEKRLLQLRDATPVDHADYACVVDAFSLMKQSCTVLRGHFERSVRTAAVLGVQRRLTGFEGPLNLLDRPQRQLVGEGDLANKRHIFLFSDLCILAKSVGVDQFKVVLPMIELDGAELAEPPAEDKFYERSFLIATASGAQRTIVCNSAADKDRWITSLSGCFEAQLKDRIFGLTLAEVLEHQKELCANSGSDDGTESGSGGDDDDDDDDDDDGDGEGDDVDGDASFDEDCDDTDASVAAFQRWLARHARGTQGKLVPSIVRLCVTFLCKADVLRAEGIFRVSGTKQHIDQFRRAIDRGETITFDSATTSPHDVTGLLKLFLRELAQPLLPFACFQPLLDAQNSLSGGALLERIASIVASDLPPPNRATLAYLLRFVRFAAKFSESSKMTSRNLSLVVSPNLLRPKVESIEATLAQPTINDVVESLIVNYTRIFCSKSSGSKGAETATAAASSETATDKAPKSSSKRRLTKSTSARLDKSLGAKKKSADKTRSRSRSKGRRRKGKVSKED